MAVRTFIRASMIASLATLAFFAVPAHAQQFFGEDATGSDSNRSMLVNSTNAENLFLADLTGVGTESFESFAQGTGADLGLSFPGAGTATLTGTGCVSAITWGACSNPANTSTSGGTNGYGRYPISGAHYWEASTGDFAIDFSDPIAAFGFYGVDIGDFGGTLTLAFLNGATSVASIGVPHTTGGHANGNAFFFGYINTADSFDRVEFQLDSGGEDVFAFDDMTIGALPQVKTVTPEPSTTLLMGTGMLGLAFLVVRRRRQHAPLV